MESGASHSGVRQRKGGEEGCECELHFWLVCVFDTGNIWLGESDARLSE